MADATADRDDGLRRAGFSPLAEPRVLAEHFPGLLHEDKRDWEAIAEDGPDTALVRRQRHGAAQYAVAVRQHVHLFYARCDQALDDYLAELPRHRAGRETMGGGVHRILILVVIVLALLFFLAVFWGVRELQRRADERAAGAGASAAPTCWARAIGPALPT